MATTTPILSSASSSPDAPGGALRGVLWAAFAFFLFASNDAITKALTARYAIFQIIALQVTFSVIPIALFVLRQGGGWRALCPIRPMLTATRGLLAGIGSVFGYYAFSTLPLADVYAIQFCVPIVVTLLSIPLLGERVGLHRWAAVLLGFLGVLVMIRPGAVSLSLGHLAALGAVFTGAGVTLILRRISREERGPALVLSVVLGLLTVSLPVLPFVFRMPSLADTGLLALSGLLIGTAQFSMLNAFRRAQAASVAPIQYTMMVWALVYGLLLFGDPVRPHVLAGAAVVILSSLYIMHRERQRGVGA